MRKSVIGSGMVAVGIAASAAAIEPGNWESTSVLTDLTLPPGMPAGAEDMMRQMMGGEGMTAESCVTQDDIDNAPERIFQDTQGQCRYTEFEMAGGELYAVAQCSGPQGDMHMVMDGTYTDATYAMTMQMSGNAGMGDMTMQFAVTGRRVGAC